MSYFLSSIYGSVRSCAPFAVGIRTHRKCMLSISHPKIQCFLPSSSYFHSSSKLFSKSEYDEKPTLKESQATDQPLKDVPSFLHPAEKFASESAEKTKRFIKDYENRDPNFPYNADVVIIGGGAMGLASAYWILSRVGEGNMQVAIVEEDPTYSKASSTLSVGGIRQQFSLPENVHLSLFGAQFLRQSKRLLAVKDVDPPDVCFNPQGYLTLASELGAEQLFENWKVQRECGAQVELLLPEELKERYPWMNTEEVALGIMGTQNEGWFDPWALICALKRKAVSLGASFVKGEVVDVLFENKSDMIKIGVEDGQFNAVTGVKVKMADGEIRTIKSSKMVVTAGSKSANIAKMIGMGQGPDTLAVPFPVEPRKRYVFVFHSPDAPGLDFPFLIDYTGMYVRREGLMGNYLCGISPAPHLEPTEADWEVDYDFFDDHLWPLLAARIPHFQNLKVKSAWAGHYDYNVFDQNAIVGPHCFHGNVYFATGFSGHGIQHSPGIGRAISELVLDGEYKTIDLSRLSFSRVVLDEPIREIRII